MYQTPWKQSTKENIDSHPDSVFETRFEEFQRVQAKFIQLLHSHAGIACPSIIGNAFSYLQMEMIRGAEIGPLEFIFVEKARQRCLFIHPISHVDLYLFDMRIN